MDLDRLSPQEEAALDEIVHDQASKLASETINSGQSVEWLQANGWTPDAIRDRISEMITGDEPT
jgi:hypothetical protein